MPGGGGGIPKRSFVGRGNAVGIYQELGVSIGNELYQGLGEPISKQESQTTPLPARGRLPDIKKRLL